MSDDLWIEGPDEIANTPTRRRPNAGRHIGCPLWWFTWVYSVVRGKGELAVALYLYRLRVVQRSRTVKVSNVPLAKLGIDRYVKYRTLKRLATAGVITVRRKPHRSHEIVFHLHKRRRR